jgi:hypothetical protein
MRSLTSWLTFSLAAIGVNAAPFQSFDKRQDGGKMVFAHMLVSRLLRMQQRLAEQRRLALRHGEQAPQTTTMT